MLLRCKRLETLMSQMGHQLPLGLGVECFRFTPVSGLYLKLIDWPKGAMNRLTPCSKQCLYPVTLASSTVLGSQIVKVEPRPDFARDGADEQKGPAKILVCAP